MNGPTERPREVFTAQEVAEAWRDGNNAARGESASLRARVAVLEQQIAAIVALCDETDNPEHGAVGLVMTEDIRGVLAAGVVDNRAEDEANADPFTLDDLGHPTEGSPS